MYNTTLTEYKGVLNKWFKGTGGGSGLAVHLESWSDAKLEKYNINIDNYDHTDVSNRPAILFDKYHNDSHKPYLTIIHLWDAATHNLLSSRYDPFCVKGSEVGMLENDSEDSSLTSSSKTQSTSRKRYADNTSTSSNNTRAKRKASSNNTNKKSSPSRNKSQKGKNYEHIEDIGEAIQGLMGIVKQTQGQPKKAEEEGIESLPLVQLYNLMDQHKNHLKFLQENGMCSEKEKSDIVDEVKKIYNIIVRRSNMTNNITTNNVS